MSPNQTPRSRQPISWFRTSETKKSASRSTVEEHRNPRPRVLPLLTLNSFIHTTFQAAIDSDQGGTSSPRAEDDIVLFLNAFQTAILDTSVIWRTMMLFMKPQLLSILCHFTTSYRIVSSKIKFSKIKFLTSPIKVCRVTMEFGIQASSPVLTT